MSNTKNLTEGKIMGTLLRFAVPVFFALFLQALYGGVDLLVVGQFAQTADVSGVSSGSMLLSTVTMIVTGVSMGITVLVGEMIGKGEPESAGKAIGSGICLFAVGAVILSVFLIFGADILAGFLHAPQEAFELTAVYIRICGAGAVFIIAYNVLGAVFRGIGDSKTPLITVIVACVVNIVGDVLLVAVIVEAQSYLKAYAIDCMLTPLLFCFIGYYNGCEKTVFVMIQGLIGAFGVRIPVVYAISRIPGVSLFGIGLGTPASSVVQILLCIGMFVWMEKQEKRKSV